MSLSGCASKSDGTISSVHKSFELGNASKLIVISVDGKRFGVTDTDMVRQITDNVVFIQFEKGESNEDNTAVQRAVEPYGFTATV